MNILEIKKGRSGDPIARAIAKRYVELFEEAAHQPDGKLWVEFEEDGLTQTTVAVDINDPKPLLDILKNFASTGYFEGELQDKVRFIEMSKIYDEYKHLKKTYTPEASVNILADKYDVSEVTIERRITAINKVINSSNGGSI